MRTLTDSIWLLSLQLAAGSALLLGLSLWRARAPRRLEPPQRRRRAVWIRARPALLRAACGGAGASLLLLPLRGAAFDPALLVAGAIVPAGGVLLHAAARLERRGRLRAARDQARLGGHTVAVGLSLLLLSRFAPPGATLDLAGAAAIALLTAAAIVALLAGLAAKPRPSCHAATLLYLAAVILLVGTG